MSTFSSPTSKKSLAILAMGLLAVIPISVIAARVEDDTTNSVADQLLEPPQDGEIWLLGNSIFKTGVDPEVLERTLGGPSVSFEYHGGHYTSLWYLIANNALPELEETPAMVVWGFRPAYGALPAFRQNVVNDTEKFLVPDDPVYERLAQGIAPPDLNPLDSLAEDVDDALRRTGIFSIRSTAADELSARSLRFGVQVADALGASGAGLVEREVINGDATLLDLLNEATTGGEIQLAEERIVDGVGDFVSGEPAAFVDSFVPVIADRLDALGLRQLIIIWPPRSVAEGTPPPEEQRFVADAVQGLADAGYPVLNLYDDRDIGLDLYASGDHFNPDGRAVITQRVADAILELGFD